jgi:hypothetical protein
MRKLRGFNFTPAARVVRGDASSPRFVGLKNLTSEAWWLADSNGSQTRINPNGVTPLIFGTKLYFPGGVCVLG